MAWKMMNLAGNAGFVCRFGFIALVLFGATCAYAQVRGSGAQTQPSPTVRRQESSVTVQQVAARQEQNYAQFKNAHGTVVWTYKPTSGAPATCNIFFAYEGDKAVTLVLPENLAAQYRQGGGVGPWSMVMGASFVNGDYVQAIAASKNSTAPLVTTTYYNPAVHDNNPLARFHPRLIGDERVPLRELAHAVPQMASRPTVTDVSYNGTPAVQIDFGNPKVPGESIYYVVDPARGWMSMEVGRVAGGKIRSRSIIKIGRSRDGIWLPARRTRYLFDEAGKLTGEESWHYDFFAANEGLPPQTLSLAYFQLPVGTRFTDLPKQEGGAGTPGANAGRINAPALQRTPAATGSTPARRERIAPKPMTVPQP